ncbi:MAG: hypothetical protein WCE63_04160 [Acidobacteriaceae bacterium]
MAGWLMQSNALGVVKVLFWASAFTSLASVSTDRYLHSVLKTHWKLILFSLGLVLLWRIPPEGEFFHGIEYEDSYVYTVAGRQMAEHIRIEPSGATLPYSINVCAVGSLTSCKQYENYPEHLIGYPYILSALSNIFGYQPSIGSIANVACACFADIFIFLVCMMITDDVIAAGSAVLIFAITPVFAVWGLETSAEPISNGCMSLILWFCLRHVSARPGDEGRWHALLTWCAFTAILPFSLTVKRENILLGVLLPVIALIVHVTTKRPPRLPMRNVWGVVLSAMLALFLSLQMRLFRTMSDETDLLRKFPPTPGQLIALLPVFLHSFFIVEWYGGAVILVLIGAIITWRRKSLGLFPLIVFAAYVLLYAFHIRSYYELLSGNTSPRSALRFSMNLMSVWSILAGVGAATLVRWLSRTRMWERHRVVANRIAVGAVVVIVAVSYGATTYFREDVVEDEFRMRIEPSLAALRIATDDRTKPNYILTMEPLIPQMYAEPTVDVLSLPAVNGPVMQQIGFSQGTTGILYLDETIHRTPADAERYKDQFEYLHQFPENTITSNDVYSIIRIAP